MILHSDRSDTSLPKYEFVISTDDSCCGCTRIKWLRSVTTLPHAVEESETG